MTARESSPSSIDRIKELLEYYPDDVLLLITLGRGYMQQGQYREAEEAFLRAVDLDPAYSVAYRYLAQAYEKSGNVTGAAETYEHGIRVARGQGDMQAAKEMKVFLKRLTRDRR
ncbi:MAG: tetratricopeptide repeat protein [Fidelibacterota bacterium]